MMILKEALIFRFLMYYKVVLYIAKDAVIGLKLIS